MSATQATSELAYDAPDELRADFDEEFATEDDIRADHSNTSAQCTITGTGWCCD